MILCRLGGMHLINVLQYCVLWNLSLMTRTMYGTKGVNNFSETRMTASVLNQDLNT